MKDKYTIKNKQSMNLIKNLIKLIKLIKNLIKIVHRKILLTITNYHIFTQIHTHMHAQHAESTHTLY